MSTCAANPHQRCNLLHMQGQMGLAGGVRRLTALQDENTKLRGASCQGRVAGHGICRSLNLVRGLLSSIKRCGLRLTDLDERVVDQYIKQRAGQRCIRPGDQAALKRLLSAHQKQISQEDLLLWQPRSFGNWLLDLLSPSPMQLSREWSPEPSRRPCDDCRPLRNAGAFIGLDYRPVASRHIFADGSRRNVRAIFLRRNFGQRF